MTYHADIYRLDGPTRSRLFADGFGLTEAEWTDCGRDAETVLREWAGAQSEGIGGLMLDPDDYVVEIRDEDDQIVATG